jgi:hypothetical protein
MQCVGDGYQVTFTAQDQRRATMGRKAKCSERLINIPGIMLPAKQADAEVSHGDGTQALRDQGRRADTYLDTRIKRELFARDTVLPQAACVAGILNPPLLTSVSEPWCG